MTSERTPRGNGERILVVDDEAGIRSVVGRILERFGYQVVLAAHGAEGLALFAADPAAIALVLTDLTMPEMDGPAMAAAIRALAPAARILASSGMITPEEEARARAAGIAGFVPKPYSAEGLLTAIHRALADVTRSG